MTPGMIVSAIITLGVLIFIHELGHFLVAKRLGVGVLKFSLGFGKRLWGFRLGETEYLLSAIPLGGYVKMVGEDPREVRVGPDGTATDAEAHPLDLAKSFAHKPVWARALIILAGPGANFLLAVVIFTVLFMAVGRALPEPVIGPPAEASPAAGAGLRAGDRIRAVDGDPVRGWEEIASRLQQGRGAPVAVTVERAGETRTVRLTPVPKTVVSHVLTAEVGRVTPNFPAEAAGLRRGDRIVAINGQPVETWPDLAQVIHASPGRPVILTLLRGEERLEVTVTPRASRPPDNPEGREIGLIGIEPINDVIRKESQVWDLGIGPAYERLHPLAALAEGVRRTVDVSVTVLWFLGKLLQGALPAKTIGGPLTIVLMAGEQAQQGFLYLVTFTAVISINLAILNLLPIPILDGGHLLFAAIEAVRGEPVSVRRREMAQKVGLALLVAIMVFALYNDIFRAFGP
ncbi:MAG: RIP metalloprotease RseP [candidate division NC10 bacterium]|nr:RIP metalloprotease RseP [candidate division NC10 bacterium]MBI4413500.1 RIP metalloprotease RseP [candidate division NC10 bacterium]